MITIGFVKKTKRTPVFTTWMNKIPDDATRATIAQHIVRLESGLGDVQSVGDGVYELRIHLGAGWRVYFITVAGHVILLLVGGTKRTQKSDIVTAKKIVKDLEKASAAAKAATAKPTKSPPLAKPPAKSRKK